MKFALPSLPYDFAKLEPYIDQETMKIHYENHHGTYVNNLNSELNKNLETDNLEYIVRNVSKYSDFIRNNAGGHYNHSFFWTIISGENSRSNITTELSKAIIENFGSLEDMKQLFMKRALTVFGSGWTWLCVDNNNTLFLTSTANQDNPLMDTVTLNGTPILGIDLWEHAYYLKYRSKRALYIEAFWEIINWPEVSKRYEEIIKK